MNDNDFLKPDETISSDKQLMHALEIEKIIEELKKEHHLEFGPAEIGCFFVYPNISKQTVAKCVKSSIEVKFYSGNDYLIEVSGEVWDMLDKKTKKLMILHELFKIDPTFTSKTQEWKMKLRTPDFSGFYSINDKFGNDWYKTIQATASSLYDLDPKQESKVSV